MTTEQREQVKNREWRKLLTGLPDGATTIVVKTVGDIKSLRSVASDLNTDPSIPCRYSIEANREFFDVTVSVGRKS